MESTSRYHFQQIARLGGNPHAVLADDQDRILADLVVRQVDSLRSQRSGYLPAPLTVAPVFLVR